MALPKVPVDPVWGIPDGTIFQAEGLETSLCAWTDASLMRTIVHMTDDTPAPVDYFAGDSRTNRQRMLAGDLYIADDPENAAAFHRALRLSHRYTAAYVEDPEEALRAVTGSAAAGDVVLTIGAGDVTQYGARLVGLLTERAAGADAGAAG